MNTTPRLEDLDVTLSVDQPASHPGSVLHIYGQPRPSGADAQVAQVTRLLSDGWAACVVVPLASAWDDVTHALAHAGSHVVRTRARSVPLIIETARLVRRRARWLVANDFDAIHAHDDVAAAEWGMAARRSRTAMVWDIDLRAPRSWSDLPRAACASLVIARGSGARLDAWRRLPPVRSAAVDHVGNWYHLAPDVHDRPAMVNVTTVADVYAMLTGTRPSVVPAPALDRARAALAAR